MATAKELLGQLRANAATKVAERNKKADELAALRDAKTTDLARVTSIRASIAGLDKELDEFRGAIKRAEDELDSSAAVVPTVRDFWSGQGRSFDGADYGGSNARGYELGTTTRSRDVYSRERAQSGERSFFVDLYHSQAGELGATQRLAQFHQEARATSTGSFAGLVVPQYLVEQTALLARMSRPFANSLNRQDMPEQGMQFQIPRGTTGASTAVQATENAAVSLTDEVFTNVTLNVATIAGQAQPSRQSIERGMPGLDQLIFADLAGSYGEQVETQCLTGSGAAGNVLGILNTAGISQATAFGAAATAGTFYTKVAGQIQTMAASRGLGPTHIVMHPRRWAWLLAQVDAQGRPLVTPDAISVNSMGMGDGSTSTGEVGTFLGLRVIASAKVPTSVGTGPEDQVIVYRAADHLIYENNDGTPGQLRFEQTLGNQLTVTLVSYGYLAATFGRYPSAVGVIGGNATVGNGLVAPTF